MANSNTLQGRGWLNLGFLTIILVNLGLMPAIILNWQLFADSSRIQQLLTYLFLTIFSWGAIRSFSSTNQSLSPVEPVQEYFYWRLVGGGLPLVAIVALAAGLIGWSELAASPISIAGLIVSAVGSYLLGFLLGGLLWRGGAGWRIIGLALLAWSGWRLVSMAGQVAWPIDDRPYLLIAQLCLTTIFGLLLLPVSQLAPRLKPAPNSGPRFGTILPSSRLGAAVAAILAICLRSRQFIGRLVLATGAIAAASYLMTRLTQPYQPFLIGAIIAVLAGLAVCCLVEILAVVARLAQRGWPVEPVLWTKAAFWSSLILVAVSTFALNGLIVGLGVAWSWLAVGLTVGFSASTVVLTLLIIAVRPQSIATG